MRFDTINKKPKLYAVLIATAVLAVVMTVIILLGLPASHPGLVGLVFALYFAFVLADLIWAYRRQIQYNPYSYNTIYYFGFSLVVVMILSTIGVLTYRMLTRPESYAQYESMYTWQGILLNSAKMYMILTSPFILVVSILLVISNLSLIRHEGKRRVNILGIILAFLLVGGELLVFRFDMYASGSWVQVMVHDLVVNFIASCYLYFECMLIGAGAAAFVVSRYKPDLDKDCVIINGCGIRSDGTPTPILKGRIDKALEFARRQKEETGKDLTFVTSGGQGPNEVISESACMKRYLMEQGIPGERIIEEDQSTNTFENMKFSKEKIMVAQAAPKVAFSTTNYHVFRTGLYSRRVKMRAVGMGARTKWYFWPNALVREFVGLLTEHRGKQLMVLTGMIIFYAVLTVLNYTVVW